MNTEEQKNTPKYVVVDRQELLEIIANIKPPNIWITSEEVKEILRIKSDTTLQTLRNKNVFEIVRISSKLLLYKRSSVLEFLDKMSDKTS